MYEIKFTTKFTLPKEQGEIKKIRYMRLGKILRGKTSQETNKNLLMKKNKNNSMK